MERRRTRLCHTPCIPMGRLGGHLVGRDRTAQRNGERQPSSVSTISALASSLPATRSLLIPLTARELPMVRIALIMPSGERLGKLWAPEVHRALWLLAPRLSKLGFIRIDEVVLGADTSTRLSKSRSCGGERHPTK